MGAGHWSATDGVICCVTITDPGRCDWGARSEDVNACAVVGEIRASIRTSSWTYSYSLRGWGNRDLVFAYEKMKVNFTNLQNSLWQILYARWWNICNDAGLQLKSSFEKMGNKLGIQRRRVARGPRGRRPPPPPIKHHQKQEWEKNKREKDIEKPDREGEKK